MNFFKKLSNNDSNIWRYISSVGILFIVIPIIVINGLLGNVGRYIGFIFYCLIAIFALHEIFQNFNISKVSAFYLSLLVIFVFVIDSVEVKHLVNSIEKNDILYNWIKTQFKWNILYLICFSFVPILFEKKIRLSWKSAILNQMMILVILLIVSIAAKTIWIINSYRYEWLFYFFLISIISDTFGYLGGKYFAKYIFNSKKIAPNISPKKTWGGFIISYIFTGIFIGVVGYFLGIFHQLSYPIFTLILMTFILPIISSIGDLSFSGIKRYLNIKDFSNLIKGHGGIMDRLDSMSFVMFFLAIIFLFQ